MIIRKLALSTVGLIVCLVLFLHHARGQDAEMGKALYEACVICHKLEPTSSENGPTLIGIVGRKAASANDFTYSAALRRAGIVWDEAGLDSYLTDPQAFISGTRMPFSGITDNTERADLIAYLKRLR
jgi:cytochrome c